MIEKFREHMLEHLKKWKFEEIDTGNYNPNFILASDGTNIVRVQLDLFKNWED